MFSCDEKDVSLTNCLKNITMRDIIFWITDAWNVVKSLCLRKAQCSLLVLDIVHEVDPTRNIGSKGENSSLENFFYKNTRMWLCECARC